MASSDRGRFRAAKELRPDPGALAAVLKAGGREEIGTLALR